MQQDKKRTRGLTPHFDTIRTIKTDIDAINTQIETLKKQKSAEINNERDNPKRLGLLKEKSLIKEELVNFYSIIETLVSKKDNLIDELNSLRDHIKNVKGKNAFRSMADIDHQRAIIEQKMMDTHYTDQQEKEYQAIMLDLHKKKQSYGDLGGKEKRIHDLETALQSVKAQIKETSDDINLRKKEMEALNKVLDGTRNNKKSDKVAEIEKQIDALYDRKKELIENRRKEHEIIKQKEEEHAKYMEVMSKQIEAENQKKQQKLKITKMIEELTNLENERSKYDANKYETIIKEVERKNLSVSLISMLGTEKLNIPRCDADYDALLKTLVDRKNEFEKGICDKVVELNGKIKDLEEGIVEEKKVLEAMPVTEVSLERRKIK